ncbi:MAG: DNA primase [Bacilli bacterium]
MNEHDYISEIRSKVDIVDIISEYLPLTQKGKNFFGVCPFHDDTNPSMSVSRDLQIYRCFSCGASGNVFNFVMNYEHISFKESLSLLAAKAGIELKGFHVTEKSSKNDIFYTIYSYANKFYQNNLNTALGKEAKLYLKKRAITDAMIKEFGIGLSLMNMTSLTQLLISKGYDLKLLNSLGLVSEDHDTYINRIMFPLADLSGKTVGFSGRIYDDSKMNKYLNTKETPIFKKGQMLYNYHIAKEEVRIKKTIIVMEGFMDVIRSSTIGLRNIVALMGTAMTKEQANLIKRLSTDIVLCFDGDEAGIHATLTNGEHFLNMGINVRVVSLPNEMDPDTYILEFGQERFLGLVENAISYTDYKINSLRKDINLNSEESIANYINRVLEETSKITDEIRCEIILKNLAKEFNIGYNTLEKRFATIINKEKRIVPSNNIEGALPLKVKKNKYDIAVLAILYYMLYNDKVIRRYEKEGVFFPHEKERFLASEIAYYYKKYGIIQIADFYTYLNDKTELGILLTEVLGLGLELNSKAPMTEIDDYFKVVREFNVNEEVKRLTKLIKEETDPTEKAKIAEKIRVLRIGS